MTNQATAFKKDCKILNMKKEYPGYIGEITWIVISDLTQEQIMERYPEEIKPYTPFIRMTREMHEPIADFERNRLKFYYRARNHGDAYGYEDNTFECYHPEMIADSFALDEYYDLKCALAHLNETQRRRIIKRFYEDMSVIDIANEEHTTRQAVAKSITAARNNAKKFLSEG